MKIKWWKESVFYQIYPKSFYDSNDDGVGDLNGIYQKLDYLTWLGVDVLYLSPIYCSPNDDNGYDISNYHDISPEFGNISDFERLLDAAHEKNLKVILDIAINHTSDEHPWFVASRSSKNHPLRDYYIWRSPKNGEEPNNWASYFSPSAWAFDETTKEYYLHLYSKKQPDLNWENPQVRTDLYAILNFWIEKGVDGFRLDVINAIAKIPGLLDACGKKNLQGKVLNENLIYNHPKVHDYLREMATALKNREEIVLIGETINITVQDAIAYTGPERYELDMVFQFELRDMHYGENGKWDQLPHTPHKIKDIISHWQTNLLNKGWQGLFLGNHDTPRMVSCWGEPKNHWYASATLLATLLFTLQGSSFIYQGDEIGMTNVQFESIDDYQDLDTHFFYTQSLLNQVDLQQIMTSIWRVSRDNARTPMQWSDDLHAGFSTIKPWISVNPNYIDIHVKAQENNPNSILSFYKKVIHIRKKHPVFIEGSFEPIDTKDELFLFMRKDAKQSVAVLLNPTPHTLKFPDFLEQFTQKKCLVHNLAHIHTHKARKTVAPYEAFVYLCK